MSALSPRDRERLAELETFLTRVHRARGMVERFATQPGDSDTLSITVRRAFNQLKLQFTAAGMDSLAQVCTGMEFAARTGTSHMAKSGKLREGVGTLARLIEQERRLIVASAKPRRADSD